MIHDMNLISLRNIYYKLIKSNDCPIPVAIEQNNRIRKLKNKYEGQACFVIGNGPSLTHEDLTNIYKRELVSFGANSIYKMYGGTPWRPTFHVLQDQEMIDGLHEYFENFINEAGALIVRRNCYRQIDPKIRKHEKLYLPRLLMHIRKDRKFDFSEDASRFVSDGCTVTYFSLQLAYYLGFKTIYLIGIDFSFPTYFDKNDNIVNTDVEHFHAFKDNSNIVLNPARTLEALSAYKCAKEFCDERDVKILNATRGGKLEVFDRVDLDSVFSEYPVKK